MTACEGEAGLGSGFSCRSQGPLEEQKLVTSAMSGKADDVPGAQCSVLPRATRQAPGPLMGCYTVMAGMQDV